MLTEKWDEELKYYMENIFHIIKIKEKICSAESWTQLLYSPSLK